MTNSSGMDHVPEIEENTITLEKLREENKSLREQFEKSFKEINDQVMGIANKLTLTLQQQSCEQLRSKNESLQGSNDHLQAEIDTLKKELSEFRGLNERQPLLPRGTVEGRKHPAIGLFSTKDVRTDTECCSKTSKVISFSRSYPNPPCLPLGLTTLHIGNEYHMRVSCFVSTVERDSFEININGGSCTKLYQGAYTWLEIEADDPDFQCGKFSTLENLPWREESPPKANARRITFSRSYIEPPQVVVWLTAFDMEREKSWYLSTYASDVTATGFTIHIDTRTGTGLHFATASWVSYTTGKEGVYSGRFNTSDMCPDDSPQLYNSGYTTFPAGIFTGTPQVIVALHTLHVDHNYDMRLQVGASVVSAAGMLWHLNAWGATKLYSAGASYIALS